MTDIADLTKSRTVVLRRDGERQAIRIPQGWELPGEEVRLTKDGDKLVLEPVEAVEPAPERSTASLVAWLKTLEPIDPNEEPWVDPDDQPAEPVDVFDDWADD